MRLPPRCVSPAPFALPGFEDAVRLGEFRWRD
jgi:hypothetical protein